MAPVQSPDEAPTSPERGEFKNKQGLRIATYVWKAKEAKGAVITIHGYSSFAEWEFMSYPNQAYEGSMVQAFNNLGLNVHALDLQGFGRSEGYGGMRGYVNKFDDYVEDVEHFLELVKKQEGDSPIHVCGLSLGGCIAARFCQRRKENEIASCVLAAPMLSLENNVARNPWISRALTVLDYIVPWLQVGDKVPNPKFPQLTEDFRAHELSYKGLLRVRIGAEFIKAVNITMDNAKEIDCPVLFVHCEGDTMCEPQGSKKMFERVSSDKKKLVLFPEEADLWHALFSEPDSPKVVAAVAEFLENLDNAKPSEVVRVA